MERGAVDAKRVKRSTPLEPRCAMYKKDRYKGWEEGARAVGIDGMEDWSRGAALLVLLGRKGRNDARLGCCRQ